jgi:FAD/FMN-containing dehydrogenase
VSDGALDAALRAVVGDSHVLTDPALVASYETDWTRRFTGAARAVVRPGSTAEVAAVLQACAAHRVAVLVQGGNTGLVGGSVPAGGEVVLSTTRLAALEPVDVVAGQVSVGAGATLADVQQHVRRAGLDVGVDLAARDSATVGGMVATNAGGIRVCRHGSMRAQVAGIEAVLADGTVVSRLAGLPKDNTGYDLPGLLAGSEGTLAVITRVRLRLVPLLTQRAVALLAVTDTAAASRVLARLRALLPSLEAAELFLSDGLALVRAHTGLRAPFGDEHPAYLLVEVAGRTDPTDALVEALGEVTESESADVLDAVLAEDSRGREDLWRYREAHTESISAAGVPVKLDVAVPVARLPELVDALPSEVAQAAPGARVIVFGHLAEGNLHVNVLGPADPDGVAAPALEEDLAHAVEDAVLRLAARLDGSISAEHGVGRAKVEWLPLSRSAAELATMRAIKAALDPAGLLNPGVLLPR